jgi:phytoene dehydrogenase-like protein
MGVLSPYLRTLPLAAHGLEWLRPDISVAHPMDDGPAVLFGLDLDATAEGMGRDARAYEKLVRPFLEHPDDLLWDLLGPLRLWPRRPLQLARFGLSALRSARGLARGRFRGERARAAFAGHAAHSILPLDQLGSAAVGLIFLVTAHLERWPIARGGSHAITRSMAAHLRTLGGTIETGRRIADLRELDTARVVLFDTAPTGLLAIAGQALPEGYKRRLRRFVYGPGVFKLDWALSHSIPWRDPAVGTASTVHVGGTLDEIAAAEAAPWRGEHADRPYLIVCQQSHFDPSRAPAGRHTGYAYCHVPHGSTADRTEAIEAQIERFAPGFRDTILARHTTTAAQLEALNPAYVGGAITGGAATLSQLFTRPVARWSPYTTPNPRLFLCSASTPPGGGVHGMCGYWAAQAALRRALR